MTHDSSDTGTTVPIQRWHLHERPVPYSQSDDGGWVTYADHVQAMQAEAESAHDLGVIYGINHERARIRQAVEDMLITVREPYGEAHYEVDRAAVLSIIDGETT